MKEISFEPLKVTTSHEIGFQRRILLTCMKLKIRTTE